MTRGAWGFKKDGDLKILYNNHDSYPDGLGRALLEDKDKLYDLYLSLIPADAEHMPVHDTSYAEVMDLYNWVPGINIYYDDSREFINDSIFCEFAYIVDLDRDELIYYTIGSNLDNCTTVYDIKDLDIDMINYIINDMESYTGD